MHTLHEHDGSFTMLIRNLPHNAMRVRKFLKHGVDIDVATAADDDEADDDDDDED